MQELWNYLPLIILFMSGYMIYRLLDYHNVTDQIAIWFIRRSNGRIPVLILYVLIGTALLSFFISNTITVLTLLPIIKTLRNDLELFGFSKKKVTTLITLPLIYGANIGGMGSLIGGPAHLFLMGSLEVYKVPGREMISFGTWFFWSLPLVVVFILLAWGILVLIATPRRLFKERISLERIAENYLMNVVQKKAMRVFMLFILFWVFHAVFIQLFKTTQLVTNSLAIVFFIVFFYIVMIRKYEETGNNPFLPFKELYVGITGRFYLLLLLIVGVIVIVRALGLDTLVVNYFAQFIRPEHSVFITFLIVSLTVMLLTELFSNAIVAIAFLPISYSISLSLGINPIALMVCVSCATTCSFMTPIATTANALAFAQMDGISFRRMMYYGSVMNLAGAVALSVYLPFAIPFVYGN